MKKPRASVNSVPPQGRRHLDRMAVGRSAWGLYRETRRPGAPGLVHRIASAPLLVKDVTFGRYRGVTRAKLYGFFLLVALYVVSPIDAIPDFIPVLGWTDDTAVMLWFMTGLMRESGRYVEWKRVGRPPRRAVTASR